MKKILFDFDEILGGSLIWVEAFPYKIKIVLDSILKPQVSFRRPEDVLFYHFEW